MTATVVARGRSKLWMATDSAVDEGNYARSYTSEKIWVPNDVTVVGHAGNLGWFCEWKSLYETLYTLDSLKAIHHSMNVLRQCRPDASDDDGVDLLILHQDKILIGDGNASFYEHTGDFYAIGSGSGPAMGYLWAHSPPYSSEVVADSVRCAIDLVPSVGGEVWVTGL